MRNEIRRWLCVALLAAAAPAQALQRFDDRPARAGEWGFCPADDRATTRNPPSFCWRPQQGAATYELQLARDAAFDEVVWTRAGLELPVHCPAEPLAEGRYRWRVRFVGEDGAASRWSRGRVFAVPAAASVFTLPDRETLLARVPRAHPRLFVRPEDLPQLRAQATGRLAAPLQRLVARCERLLRELPDTSEPERYPPDVERKSERWRELWWGNRRRTIAVLDAAANLGFAAQMTGRDDFGAASRRLLLAAAEWDPRGATGYRYNDEAGMPFAYHFSRTYTFLYDRLDAAERERCREVMRVRGREMYEHLCPRHLWRPYSSHSNRAWHFLGEVAIAFHGEIDAAADWLWFAANVFANVYPVWSDSDGGWHEGFAYWRSYLQRFTWWADVQRSALGLDAYRLPFFARTGDYAMYITPPGARGAGFGDQNGHIGSRHGVDLMRTLAAQAQSARWQWWVEQHAGVRPGSHFVDLLRAARPAPAAAPPADLPDSRLFEGIGVAALHTDLTAAEDDVTVLFKSSPFGSQSHGYDAQNSFLVNAYGERLLVRSGRRDLYGSAHHRRWMWQTKSVNAVSVDGEGQIAHSAAARGRIAGFATTDELDWVQGDARAAYGGRLERATRDLVFCKPDLLVVFDRLAADGPRRFTAHLHAAYPMELDGARASITGERSACLVTVQATSDLDLRYTDQFDPPPRPRVELVQYHLDATTAPARQAQLVTAIQLRRKDAAPPEPAAVDRGADGFIVRAPWRDGRAVVRLGAAGIAVELAGRDGRVVVRRSFR